MGSRWRLKGTFRRTLAGAAVAALAFVLPGCQEPVTGIFHELAHQQPTVDRNLANDITIGGIARWEDRYVVAAGKLWSRPVGTEDDPGEWVPMTATFDGDDKSAVMLPLVRWKPAGGGASLLAGALLDNDNFALLQADGTQIRDDSVAWKTVPGAEVSGREVVGLFTPSDESVLFAVIAKSRGENRTYTLLSATDRSAGAPDFTVEIDDLSHPVQAVATDGNGTYWAVSGNELLYARALRALGGSWQSGTPSPEGSERFRGVIHDGSDTLILTGSTGTVWRSVDGGQTWPDKKEIRAEDQAVPLWGAVAVRRTALIGTDAHGYYTASLDDDLVVKRPKHTTKAIYDASILALWVDPESDGGKVFALTARDGLWTTRVNSGAVPEPERWELE